MAQPTVRILSIFGTRPEAVKFGPVLRELARRPLSFESLVASTSQHTELLRPFLDLFGIKPDFDLCAMRPGQTLNQLTARILARLDPALDQARPDLVLVQGDTISALAGALAAWHRRIPVAHIEAGLRTETIDSPFPEEMSRRLIDRIASLHFAATPQNVATLLREGADPAGVHLTGNPVVDALKHVLATTAPSAGLRSLLAAAGPLKLIVLTTHRREAFGEEMLGNLKALRDFIEARPEYGLAFPIHPNPAVRQSTQAALGGAPRCWLLDPLEYGDFLHLLSAAWLIVSDSGGVQEEAPSLGKPLLVLRRNTERPEAIACGVARLVGGSPERLAAMLSELHDDDGWIRAVRRIANPFGRGDSAGRIADLIAERFGAAAPGDRFGVAAPGDRFGVAAPVEPEPARSEPAARARAVG